MSQRFTPGKGQRDDNGQNLESAGFMQLDSTTSPGEHSSPSDALRVPSREHSGPSDAQIMRQLEAEMGERPPGQSPAVLAAFILSLAACVGVFGVLLSRARPSLPAPSPVVATVQAPAPAWVSWTYSFEEGQNRASASGKKMLVAFYADWCPSCRWMDSNVYTRPEVQGEATSFEMVKINSDARPDLSKRYNIRVLPSFVWTNAQGDELARHDGSFSPAEFAGWLRNNR